MKFWRERNRNRFEKIMLTHRPGRWTAAVFFACLILLPSVHAAEPKPGWQGVWENTVAAAKREGRLNFYVGRYGSEKFLDEFRKEFPEIKVVPVNGPGNSLGTRILSELRAGQSLA